MQNNLHIFSFGAPFFIRYQLIIFVLSTIVFMHKNKAVILVAGGKGLRMQTDIPKQFIEIQGKPILMHTLENFYKFDNSMQLILVIPAEHFEYWNELCKKYNFTINHSMVAGGETRFNSVLNGLNAVKNADLVAIHDGVRPLVIHDTIARCFDAADRTGTAIPVTDCIESIRKQENDCNHAVDRSQYKLVQTPQVFEINLLREAYKQSFSPLFTDDASVIENFYATSNQTNQKITLVEGNRENIKITTKFDLLVADTLLKHEH